MHARDDEVVSGSLRTNKIQSLSELAFLLGRGAADQWRENKREGRQERHLAPCGTEQRSLLAAVQVAGECEGRPGESQHGAWGADCNCPERGGEEA